MGLWTFSYYDDVVYDWPFHLYLLIVFIIIIILNPHKNEGEKKNSKTEKEWKS